MTKTIKSEKLYDELDKHFFRALHDQQRDVGLVVESLEYAYGAHDRQRELPPRKVLEDYVSMLNADQHYFPLVSALHTYFGKKVDEDIAELAATESEEQEFLARVRSIAWDIKTELESGQSGLEKFGSYGAELKKQVLESMKEALTQPDEKILAEARIPYKDTEDGKEAFGNLRMAVNYVLRELRSKN